MGKGMEARTLSELCLELGKVYQLEQLTVRLLGNVDGRKIGFPLGEEDETMDGFDVGASDGAILGDDDGRKLGTEVGLSEGGWEGLELGACDGLSLGCWDGIQLGLEVGLSEGVIDGSWDVLWTCRW